MNLTLDLQNPYHISDVPSEVQIHDWIVSALDFVNWQQPTAELTVRIVDKQEIQGLNKNYRHKDKATNILSFPFEVPAEIESDLLGDLVICHDVVVEEALQQKKSLKNHWAHMMVHGTLHLLGFDHIDDQEAEEMEALEVEILKQYHIENPYLA